MNAQTISHLIIEYRYWILIPLAVIEGPIVAFIAGTLASLHYFNIYILAILFYIRDVGLDAIYYYIGYRGGQTKFVRSMLSKINVTKETLVHIRTVWDTHPARTMFIGKLSYGIAQTFIIIAGTVRMPFVKFFKYGSLVAIVQYGTLLLLGYFFGTTLGNNFSGILQHIQYVIAIITLVISLYYILSWYMRKKFLNHKIAGSTK